MLFGCTKYEIDKAKLQKEIDSFSDLYAAVQAKAAEDGAWKGKMEQVELLAILHARQCITTRTFSMHGLPIKNPISLIFNV